MDVLVARGATCVSVLDVSPVALERAKQRLGERAQTVTWIEADVRSDWTVPRVDIWHDRAAFHFLIADADRACYLDKLRKGVVPGGAGILAAFAPDGPERCSGLPVRRYDAAGFAAALGASFALVESVTTDHCTPAGAIQRFCYALFRRIS